jgi:GST-like protein
MIDLHFCATPNGMKVAIMLEETGLAHRILPYDIFAGDQLTPAFGRINPNHKLPAIVDHEPEGGGAPLAIAESGAILQYLAEKTGQLLPAGGAARAKVLQWLAWQISGLGPMGGQASHFLRYAPAGQDYATERYVRELDRLLDVLENRLAAVPYVGGDAYSIADIAIWPGRASAFVMGAPATDRPATRAWLERVRARPAVARATARPDLAAPAKYVGRHQVLSPDEWSNMFGERMHAAVRPAP